MGTHIMPRGKGFYDMPMPKREIAMMDDLLVPEDYREDMIRVLKYGVVHTIPTAPDPLAQLLLKWCAMEERKIDVFEGRVEDEPLGGLVEEDED